MRTIQDAKSMAKSLRDDLAGKNLALSHSECLELVARQFGFTDWNTLSSRLGEAERPAVSSSTANAVQIVKMSGRHDQYAVVPRDTDPSVDIVFEILLFRDKQLVAMPCLAGRFGRDSCLEIENLLRVSCAADLPDNNGDSLTKVMVSVCSENLWSCEQMSGRLNLSATPRFQSDMTGTPFRFEIRPRRLIRGAPQAIAVLSTRDLKAQLLARQAKEAATPAAADMLRRSFNVSIYEIRQAFAQSDSFTGVYKKAVTLSDGTACRIELTPSIVDGQEMMKAQFPADYYNYIGTLGGTTIRNNLMIQVWDERRARDLYRQ